jgi:hypothetical protein
MPVGPHRVIANLRLDARLGTRADGSRGRRRAVLQPRRMNILTIRERKEYANEQQVWRYAGFE